MTDAARTRILVAVNRTEWLNLLGQNQIRLSRRRPVRVGVHPSQKEMDRVFSLAPHTNADSSVDLFVLELDPEWESTARTHPTGSSDVKILDRSMIVGHHTVANENFGYYSDVASRYGVSLGDCEFENAWIDWAVREQLTSAEACTHRFLRLINRGDAWVAKRTDKYKWTDVGRILLRPSRVIKPRPAHLDLLVKSCEEIADRTANTRDHQTFHIAVSIVWIELRTRKNPQRNKQSAPRVKSGLEISRSEPFGPPTTATLEALSYLAETYPKAFTGELTPTSVSALVEIILRSRVNDLSPDRALEILRSPALTNEEVSLLAYATVVSVGVEKIGHLIRSFEFQNWVAPDWSEEES
jgi:hypothetical protein